MKSRTVDTVTTNEEHVRLRIFDGVIPMSEAAAELLAAERGQHQAANKRISELLRFNNELEERARLAERVLKYLTTPRPIEEYHEDMGPVLWWKLPIEEPPWVGTPGDHGKEVLITTKAHTIVAGESEYVGPYEGNIFQRINVGGWPGYHTHWTPLPKVTTP